MSRLIEERLGYRGRSKSISDLGPIPNRSRLLDLVDERPDGVGQKELASLMGIRQGAVSKHLKALTQKGYVRREFTEYNEPVVYFPENPRRTE